jgi:TRAP-type C4-dicarboxylate transport system permease small subunit
MNRWQRVDARIAQVEKALIAIFLGVMILAAFAQIVLRNAFGHGLSWTEPLVRYLVLWVGLMGAALGARQGRHITIDVLTRRLPERGRRVLSAICLGVSAAVCGWLTVAGLKFVQAEAEMGDRTLLDLPVWVPEVIIPLAFALMAARFLLGSIGSRGESASPDAPQHPL